MIRRFARAGWRCVVHFGASRSEAEALCAEIAAAGGQAAAVGFDLSDADAAIQVLTDAFAEEAGPRVLVNSASIFEFDSPRDPSPALWNRVMAFNALTPIRLSAAFHRLPGGPKTIVQILDQQIFNPNPDFFSYSVSKAALASASEMMALAFAPETRVVNIAPGATLPAGDQTAEEFEIAGRLNLLRRLNAVEDVAEAVFFAATGPLAAGETLFPDSGQHLVPQPRDAIYLARERG